MIKTSVLTSVLTSALILLLFSFTLNAIADRVSTRVEVYSISQDYWDVKPGETLGYIVKQLLPDNTAMRKKLLGNIVKLNPHAFSQSNPDNLKANIRLWLPNNTAAMRAIKNKALYDVSSYSWGQTYKPKRD